MWEKLMFNCLAFMVNGKLSVGIKKYEMFFRINPGAVETIIKKMDAAK
jgi:hypothetical protein